MKKSRSLSIHSDESGHPVDFDNRREEALVKVVELLKRRDKSKTTRASLETSGTAPVFSSQPLVGYKYDSELARDQEIVMTIKTTLQLEKNQHQEEYMRRATPQVFGREIARPYLLGIVAAFSLAHDRFDWTLSECSWAFSAIEPYGIDAWGNKMALATANCVQLIDLHTGHGILCNDSWLNQAHTVEFSADGKRLLVSAAGFDAVLEFDTTNGKLLWEWFAWDHGFDQSKMGHYLVRSAERYRTLTSMGHEVLLIDDPAKHKFGIPTRHKPAHLNSAYYGSNGKILITLFHQGAGYVVDRSTGEARQIISGLLVPHKLARSQNGGYFISDTRKGRLIFLDDQYRPCHEISLSGMPGVARSPQLSEFLQNATELNENLFACIDIHRSSLWLIDVKGRRYRGVKFPIHWSVHDIASLEPEHRARIGNLVGRQFGKVAAFKQQLNTIHHFDTNGREVSAQALGIETHHRDLRVH